MVKDIGKLFGSIRIVVFFLWCIVVGLCTALVWNFLFWHLEDLADKGEGYVLRLVFKLKCVKM